MSNATSQAASELEAIATKTDVSPLNRSEIEQTFDLFFETGDLIEIRILNHSRPPTHSYFTDREILLDKLENYDHTRAEGVYFVMNKIDPAKIQKAVNVPLATAQTGQATRDADIEERRWLLIDVDPVRDSNSSASESEHALAYSKTKEVCAYLSNRGWPEPIRADSGNGAHLLYRIDMANDDEAKGLVERVLKVLDHEFSDTTVKIDTAVGNAARLCKLYGTRAQKGENSSERPHRFARLSEVPQALEPVPLEVLQDLANSDSPVTPAQTHEDFDLDRFLSKHKLKVKREKPGERGQRLLILSSCPFGPHEKAWTKTMVSQETGGKLGFKCFADKCHKKSWKDLRALYEPDFHGSQAKNQADEDRLAELAGLSLIDYDRCRDEAAKELGIRVATLDSEITKRRTRQEDEEESGAKMLFKDIELWPQSVDGTELLDKLTGGYTRFLALPEYSAEAMALWTVHAHAHDESQISPILAFVSPEKRCGKTTALDLLNRTTPRPLPASNITSAALFRSVEKWRPTMLVDEADTFLKGNEELRGIFNSGHNRSQAVVIRTSGDDHEPRVYSTWSPKVIAMIGSLPGTLEDRAIAIQMRRRRPDERVENLRGDRDHGLSDLARQCARWVRDNSNDLRKSDPRMPGVLHDRACDNWRALLAIADLAGGGWPQVARKAAEALTVIEDESSIGTLLLADIQEILIKRGSQTRISSADLCKELLALPDRPWPEISKGGKPLTTNTLSRRLRPFGIRPAQNRIGNTNVKGYATEDFAEAFERYLPTDPTDTSAQTETSKLINEIDGFVCAQTETPSVECFDSEFCKPLISKDCFYVSVGDRRWGEHEPDEWGESECFASTIQTPNEVLTQFGVSSGEIATCDLEDDWNSRGNWD